MKKHFYIMAMAIILLVGSFSNRAFAGTTLPTDKDSAATEAGMEQIKARLEEIKAMDKHALTHEQRKVLRHEVKAMRADYEHHRHGGIYISIGALIIIILLLILIF